ncbi:helix-turn-helix domain-containing protein [Pusillimonas sp.]|uniref:helix-turn-helix domain-containing protein n=1 Tax=Pusillimonas sp. TaxID=3040095 RepID=UPI0037C68CA9
MTTNLERLATSVQELVEHYALTQDELSKRSGISRQALADVLSGTSNYQVTTLLAVADSLGLELVLLPKFIAPAFADDALPRAPKVKSVVDAALERVQRRRSQL